MKGRSGHPFGQPNFLETFPSQEDQKIDAQTSQELRTNFLVTTYKLPSNYVQTSRNSGKSVRTYKLTEISGSMYVYVQTNENFSKLVRTYKLTERTNLL